MMRTLLFVLLSISTYGAFGGHMVNDLTTALRLLLDDPPNGFIALRQEKISSVWPRWKAKPIFDNSTCEIHGDKSDPQIELTCTINQDAKIALTTDWYHQTAGSIEAGLHALPKNSKFTKGAETVNNSDGAKTISTVWTQNEKLSRIEIELNEVQAFGYGRNTFSVRYLKR